MIEWGNHWWGPTCIPWPAVMWMSDHPLVQMWWWSSHLSDATCVYQGQGHQTQTGKQRSRRRVLLSDRPPLCCLSSVGWGSSLLSYIRFDIWLHSNLHAITGICCFNRVLRMCADVIGAAQRMSVPSGSNVTILTLSSRQKHVMTQSKQKILHVWTLPDSIVRAS